VSAIAIRAEGLSKEYRIGALQNKTDTLTGQLTDMLKTPIRRVGKLLRGQGYGASDLEESIWALQDVSLNIEYGEVVGVIGRNGAGKSTLLKILSQITEPTMGYADIYGRVGSLLEVGTGFHPELSGRENVFLNGAILGMSKAEIERKFDEIVAFAEVEQFIDTPVKHYSSGMYVRLAFSVAAHLEPEILLVDEVLAVGDQAFQKKCLGKMEDIAGEGRTVLFVSHNLGLIQALCKRGIYLEDGKIASDGRADQVITDYLRSYEKAMQEDLGRRIDRQGRGDIKFTKVNITDGCDPPSTILRTGGPARFEFELSGSLPGQDMVFTIINHIGQRITIFDTMESSPADKRDSTIGNKYICDIEQMLLLPGRYRLNLFLRDAGERQDVIEGAISFDVEAGHVDGRLVKERSLMSVCIPHRWTLPK
jgi:lipopolysaccharide transport system ATP-binding protein